ncbi:MAG: hypothetical protein JXB49_16760 [Bacteroidales bacterium]|nr:hypothetical protein [Bacteroidales bacterium]
MRPLKSGVALSKWLLRIGLLGFIVIAYLGTFKTFDFSFSFFISAIYLLLATLLFVGGFLVNPGLTVLSGFLIFVFSIYILIRNFSGAIDIVFCTYFIIAAIGFNFLARGNKG